MEGDFVVVRCNNCMFMTTDLDIYECPKCHTDDSLMDMDIETIVLQNNAHQQRLSWQMPLLRAFCRYFCVELTPQWASNFSESELQRRMSDEWCPAIHPQGPKRVNKHCFGR